MTDSVTSIIQATDDTGRKRLLAISGSMVDTTGDSFLLRRVAKPIARRVFSGVYQDMRAAEAVIHKSDLLWTIMRPPRLTDKAKVGSCRTASVLVAARRGRRNAVWHRPAHSWCGSITSLR